MSVRFRWLRMWWMRQHSRSRCWLICQDCCWAQEAWAAGEFYAHDDPGWYFDECMERAEPVEIVAAPSRPDITVGLDGTAVPTPQTYAGGDRSPTAEQQLVVLAVTWDARCGQCTWGPLAPGESIIDPDAGASP